LYLTEEEKIGLSLRELYHNRGFTRVRPNCFEEYSLYEANKKFLETDNIVTFMDSDSRLMALKPDVTLSVVRGLPDNCDSRRLYYADDVYRFSSEQRAYKVLHQVGAEIFGTDEQATDAEAIALVLASLDCVSPHTSLAISYLGEPSYDWKHALTGDPRIRIDDSLDSDMD
jgi:ATP phosphoribosyltransferase regulatory subunit